MDGSMMGDGHALMVGMFWGGLLVAAVPLSLSLALGVFLLRRSLYARRRREAFED